MTGVRLGELKRVRSACVHKRGQRAALLEREEGAIRFRYLDEYTGPDIATSLPRGGAAFRSVGGALPPFFSGLLPEGRRLTAIRQAAKTSADDELTLLLAVGRDAIGDVRVVPMTEADPAVAEASSALEQEAQGEDEERLVSLADCDFEELFARVVAPEPEDRVALPGVQRKVSGRMLSLPLAYAGHAWILKLDPPEYPHLVHNEAFFYEAARACRLPCAETEVVYDRQGRPGLLVRRFDRVQRPAASTNAGLRSLAQEDACQVLGRYPADKYLVTSEDLVAALAARSSAPVVAARSLLQQIAFAYLTCNGDAHAKNFSIVEVEARDSGAVRFMPTPAYDIPSTHAYGDTTMALTVQGKDREDIGRRDFIALGDDCGVREKAVERLLDDLLARASTWIDRLGELPFDARTCHKLRRACEYRVERLRRCR